MSIDAHKYIYMSIAYLTNQEKTVDALSIYNLLSDASAKKALEEIGGMEYIDALYSSPVSDNLDLFCKHVKDTYTLRQIYYAGKELIEKVVIDGANPEKLMVELEKKFLDISLDNQTDDAVYKMGEETEARMKKRQESPSDIAGIPLGMTKLDKAIGGAQPGNLILVVAESKTGKSVTLLNWTHHIVINLNLPMLYIDTEMYSSEQEDRLLSIMTQIPEEEIRNGKFATDTIYGKADDKIEKYVKATKLLQDRKFFHVYLPNFTVDKIRTLVKKYQMLHNIAAVTFDYIQLPSSDIGSLKFAAEYQQLGFITAGLKDIAGLCQVPILSAAQENRSGIGSTEKDARNLGGSYRILQKASKLIFLRNKTDEELATEGPSKGNQKMKIKYQRQGGSDLPEINIMFDQIRITQREI